MPIVLWVVLPVGTLGASLSEIEKKINSTQGRIQNKKGTEHALTTVISSYNARIRGLQGSITTLTTKVTRLQTDLDKKRALLSSIQSDLRFQRARKVRLKTRLEFGRKTLAKRLVELYQSDRPDLISVLLNSKGFADLIEREQFISRIGEQDRQIIELVAAAKRDATDSAARLADLESRQRKITSEVLVQRNQIADARGKLLDQRQGYASQRDKRAQVLASTRNQRHELEGELTNLQAEEQKIQNALASANGLPTLPAGPIRGSGQMIWPVNGPITSPFCERRAWEACHPGIDIGVPAGTPIRAAAAGTVALMQSEAASGGYGNFTCIAHSSSLSTCYAHQSRFATSMGAHVAQGQIIGYSGCTGRCFGDHLHFEVRVNGAVTNPLNYL
ncbi:MAG: peptidoglycan DD-metalloendopeptidase family protein [Solirubrobacterales bacterium]|nr:peptidoglycan DD-metalloendopeptidase family protein [Solirubrobacterales bacterium]